MLIGVGGNEQDFSPSPFKILISSVSLGILFFLIITTLLLLLRVYYEKFIFNTDH